MQDMRLKSAGQVREFAADHLDVDSPTNAWPKKRIMGKSSRLNVVLICHFGRTGYNILRALRASNARVFVVHDNRSSSMRFSRYCKVVYSTKDLAVADRETVLEAINDLHIKIGVDLVMAADVESLALLGDIKDRLLTPVFPMSDTETLALLNNKWRFHELCAGIGVADPKTLYFERKADIDPKLIAEKLGFPAVAKPVESYGQRGIVIMRDEADVQAIRPAGGPALDGPTIVQEHVEGSDWALSVFARDGVIEHWVAWLCPGQLDRSYGVGRFLTTHFLPRRDLFEMGKKIVAATNFSGVANFDARFDEKERTMKMFECNPRFFNRMSAARLCGLDFVKAGLPNGGFQPFEIGERQYYPWQELFSKRGLKRLVRSEWRLDALFWDLYEMASDPLPPIVRKVAREDDRD
jgi:predicted ATP-grasp superfamily ATP-dependent carboligase